MRKLLPKAAPVVVETRASFSKYGTADFTVVSHDGLVLRAPSKDAWDNVHSLVKRGELVRLAALRRSGWKRVPRSDR
jgi:hypothetical protein